MSARGVVGFALAGLLGVLLGGTEAGCSNSSSTDLGLLEACTINSDCKAPLICAFSRCHAACTAQRDCPAGQRCVATPQGGVCQLDSESACNATTLCQVGQVCGADGQCREPCTTAGGCAAGDYCVEVGSAGGTCYSATSQGDMSTLVAAGVLAPDGAVLEDASALIVVDAGGDGTEPPASGSDAAQGADAGPVGDATTGADSTTGQGSLDGGEAGTVVACDAGTLPDGACDYCSAGGCAHGACVNGPGDFSCQCYGGYTHPAGDAKTCVVVDSCLANNRCPPAYPCTLTAPPGQACQGQYAAWHVADSDPTGSGTTVLPSYANNGDGTITDQVTTLTWEIVVPTPAAGCAVADGGSLEGGAASCTLADATARCAALTTGGHTDWRVPSFIELTTLLDYSPDNPPYIAPAFLPTPSTGYWTSSMRVDNTTFANVVDFSSTVSLSVASATTTGGTVRCVRGTGISGATPAVHYTINPGAIDAGSGDAQITGDTVTDNYTGLTWERMVTVTGAGYTAAYDHCAALGGGFRLPTFKELVTLWDPLVYSPAIDSSAFPGTNGSDQFWTSTLVQPGRQNNYTVGFSGTSNQSSTSSNWGCCPANDVRCVR